MISDVHMSDEPHTPLTIMGAAMLELLDSLPGGDETRAVLMLDNGREGGIAIHGYDDENVALAEIIVHLGAIFQAHGKQLIVMPMESGFGRG